MYIFVYGTLKQGFRNAGLLRDAEFISKATTTHAKYRMVTFDSEKQGHTYPALFDDGTCFATGEVYKITSDILKGLDALEREGDRYLRRPIDLDYDQGLTLPCEVYISTECARPHLDGKDLDYCLKANTYAYTIK